MRERVIWSTDLIHPDFECYSIYETQQIVNNPHLKVGHMSPIEEWSTRRITRIKNW
jgi:hypothetical protein